MARWVRCVGVALSVVAAWSSAVSACSLADPFTFRPRGHLSFVARALADTVVVSVGAMELGTGIGSGEQLSRGRVPRGQRFSVMALGRAAQAALPPGTREVVLVPWGYDGACRPFIWGGSAQWVKPGVEGVYRAVVRERSHWVDGVPTFDLLGTEGMPYPGTRQRERITYADGRPLELSRMLAFLDAMPEWRERPDSAEEMAYARRLLTDSALSGAPFVDDQLRSVFNALRRLRMSRIITPIGGTWELQVTPYGAPARPLFVRIAAVPFSAPYEELSRQRLRDTTTWNVPPARYDMYAWSAFSRDSLPTACQFMQTAPPHIALSYVMVDAPAIEAATTGRASSIPIRIMEQLLGPPQINRGPFPRGQAVGTMDRDANGVWTLRASMMRELGGEVTLTGRLVDQGTDNCRQ